MRLLVSFISLALAYDCFAASNFISAQAAYPGETYSHGIARQKKSRPNFYDQESPLSAYKFKVPFSRRIDFSILPEWTLGAAKLEEAFKYLRDVRQYQDSNHPNFSRRTFWLYPVDGCYLRASHAAQILEQLGYTRAGKIFALGTWATLRAQNQFAPGGASWWLFHTAAAYRIGSRAFVLDPAIDPTRVLPIEEWIGLIAPDPTLIQVAICDTNAFSPEQTCRGGSKGSDSIDQAQMQEHLDLEWKNVSDLGFDPAKVLGDFPPWK